MSKFSFTDELAMGDEILPKSAQPKRILSLDGGGLRGVVAIAFLEQMEKILSHRQGRAVALREHFDLIGGTSTGAIIATALALGIPIATLKSFYFDLGPKVFRPVWHRGMLIRALFNSAHLRREFHSIVADRTLGSEDIGTGLAIILKRVDTGSVWFLSNNRASKYWDARPGHYKGNKDYRLDDLLIAATAAPTYFDPSEIEINEGRLSGLFIDAGVSPFNDPSLALLMMATVPAYGYGWPTGENELEIVSVGTGSYRFRMSRGRLIPRIAGFFAARCLQSTLSDNAAQSLTLMQALGRNRTRWWVNEEIGDMGGSSVAPHPLYSYERYDVVLDVKWLLENTGIHVEPRKLERWQDMAKAANMHEIYSVATAAAHIQMPLKASNI